MGNRGGWRGDSIREELLTEMKTNKELGGDVTEDVLDYLSPLDDVVALLTLQFTLQTCGSKQAMLEVQKLSRRAKMLIDDLRSANTELKLYKDLLGDQPDSGPPETKLFLTWLRPTPMMRKHAGHPFSPRGEVSWPFWLGIWNCGVVFVCRAKMVKTLIMINGSLFAGYGAFMVWQAKKVRTLDRG